MPKRPSPIHFNFNEVSTTKSIEYCISCYSLFFFILLNLRKEVEILQLSIMTTHQFRFTLVFYFEFNYVIIMFNADR